MQTDTRPAVNPAAEQPAPLRIAADLAAAASEHRAGWRTSEFWILLASLALVAALAFADVLPANIAAITLLAAPAIFQLLRNALKAGQRGALSDLAGLALDHAEQLAKLRAENAAQIGQVLQSLPVRAAVRQAAPPAPRNDGAGVQADPASAPTKIVPIVPQNPAGGFITPRLLIVLALAALALAFGALLAGCGALAGRVHVKACRDVGGATICADSDFKSVTLTAEASK